jgi:hypothetical protein
MIQMFPKLSPEEQEEIEPQTGCFVNH